MNTNNKFIVELQGLRGIAVIFVLLFHFYPEFFPGGFIGVDIFFVLSGFLVTMSLFKNAQQEKLDYSFIKNFYARRISRILPMATLISFLAFILQLFFSGKNEMLAVTKSIVYSLLGLTNIKLYFDSNNYFSIDSDFSFFTHTWSLGIEEQFYLIYSISMLISIFFSKNLSTFKNVHLKCLTTFTIISFLIIFFPIDRENRDIFNFYMLPSRLFELSLGAILFLIGEKNSQRINISKWSLNFIYIICYILIFISLLIPYKPSLFPLPSAIIVVTPTLIICFLSTFQSGHSFSQKILSQKFLVFSGNISYSLYLIHWLVIVTIRHTIGTKNSFLTIGILLSFVFSSFTYKKIEKPAQRFLLQNNFSFKFGLIILLISISLLFYNSMKNPLSISNISKKGISSWKLELKCHGKNDMKKYQSPIPDCLGKKTNKKTIYITGDSHAMQLVFAFEKIYTDSGEVRYINTESEHDSYGFTRIKTNYSKWTSKVLDYIEDKSKKDDIVFMTFATFRINKMSEENLKESFLVLDLYIKKLNKKGVIVLLALDTPHFGKLSINQCIISHEIFNDSSKCEIKRLTFDNQRKVQIEWFNKLSSRNKNTFLFDYSHYFCDREKCSMIFNNNVVFFDSHHITKPMSQEISNYIQQFMNKNNIF